MPPRNIVMGSGAGVQAEFDVRTPLPSTNPEHLSPFWTCSAKGGLTHAGTFTTLVYSFFAPVVRT